MLGQISKDAGDVLWYTIDWSQWLGEDTITSSAWTLPGGIVKEEEDLTSTKTLIKLAGGFSGTSYVIINTILTTTDEETKVESFTVKIK